MPVKPKPCIYVCPSCGWNQFVAPRSDALMPGEYFSECPTCGCRNIATREPTVFERAANQIFTKNFR